MTYRWGMWNNIADTLYGNYDDYIQRERKRKKYRGWGMFSNVADILYG